MVGYRVSAAILQTLQVAAGSMLRSAARGPLGAALAASPRVDSAIMCEEFDRPDVCILGGGFGGLYTALKLSQLDWGESPRARVTLIDRSDRFAFLPMLYELTVGTASCWEVAPTFSSLLTNNTDIRFVRGTVKTIDEVDRLVAVDAFEGNTIHLPYDRCVLALGSEAYFANVPGAREHTQPFYTLDDALSLRKRLLTMRKKEELEGSPPTPPSIALVGASYVGVELAGGSSRQVSHKSRTQVSHTSLAHKSRTQVSWASSSQASRADKFRTSLAHKSRTQVSHTSLAHKSRTHVSHTRLAHKSRTPVLPRCHTPSIRAHSARAHLSHASLHPPHAQPTSPSGLAGSGPTAHLPPS